MALRDDPALMREYKRLWVAKRRSDWFEGKGPCRLCWSYKNLELHHLDPKEKESHRIWSWNIERIDREYKKCTILCQDCHSRVHVHIRKEDARASNVHGTENMYSSSMFECRCELCTMAHAVWMRNFRRGVSLPSKQVLVFSGDVLELADKRVLETRVLSGVGVQVPLPGPS